MTDNLSPFASGAAYLPGPGPNAEAEAGSTWFTIIVGSLAFLSDCHLEIIPEVPSEFLPVVPGVRQAFVRATTSAPVTFVDETAQPEQGADETAAGVSCSALSDMDAFGAEEAGRLTEFDKHFHLMSFAREVSRSHPPSAREVSNTEVWSCADQAQSSTLEAAAAKRVTQAPTGTLGERSCSTGLLLRNQQAQGPTAAESGSSPRLGPEGRRQASLPPAAAPQVGRWTCGGSAPQLLVHQVAAAQAASFTLDFVW